MLTPRTVRATQLPLGRCVAQRHRLETDRPLCCRTTGSARSSGCANRSRRRPPRVLITPTLVGSACRSGVLPGWIGLECARRAGGLPLRPGLGLVEPSHGPRARRPVWRLSRCIATSRLHPRIVDFTLIASCLFGQCCLSCALKAVRRSSRADRPLCCQLSATRSRGDLGVASSVQVASRQLRSHASATRSRSVLGHGRCAPSRTASRPSRRRASMPRPQKRRQSLQGVDVITVLCHARGDRYLGRRRATRSTLPECHGERGFGGYASTTSASAFVVGSRDPIPL